MPTKFYLRYPGGLAKALTFSYDDGVTEDLRLIEIFEKHGLKGTFNINSECLAAEDADFSLPHQRVSANDILNHYDKPFVEIACHGCQHKDLTWCSDDEIIREVVYDRRNLEQLLGRRVTGMAYAFGRYDDRVISVLKEAGIDYCRATKGTVGFEFPKNWLALNPTCHHDNPRLMELADTFINKTPSRPPELFYVWGHAYEFGEKDNWHVIESFAEKIAHKDDIWYATNMEIYRAYADFKRLKISVNCDIIYNPNCRDVWVYSVTDGVFKIGAGETWKRSV